MLLAAAAPRRWLTGGAGRGTLHRTFAFAAPRLSRLRL